MARSNLIPNALTVYGIHLEMFICDILLNASFGLPHTYLNIGFSEITGLFDGVFIRLF